jgi:hypothetical protein
MPVAQAAKPSRKQIVQKKLWRAERNPGAPRGSARRQHAWGCAVPQLIVWNVSSASAVLGRYPTRVRSDLQHAVAP